MTKLTHNGIELRQIPKQPNHFISQTGRIWWRNQHNGEMTEKTRRFVVDGYLRVRCGKKKKEYLLHHLILFAWVGPRPTPKHEACHKDDNQMNNHLSNLMWGTRSDNMKQRAINGKDGKAYGLTRVNRSWKDKVLIAAEYPRLSYRQLGRKHNLHIGTIWKIVHEVNLSEKCTPIPDNTAR